MRNKLTKSKNVPQIVTSGLKSQQFVLVGTYKKEPNQLKWIGKRHLYNYPLSAEEANSGQGEWGKVKELWLYSGAKDTRHIYAVEFVGIKARKDFLAEHPDYPKGTGKGDGDFYAIFKVQRKYQPTLEDSVVTVRVKDFTRRTPKIAQAIKAYQNGADIGCLLDYLPAELAPLSHNQLRVCEAAVQLNFWDLPNMEEFRPEIPFPPLLNPKFTFIDLFAGIGGFHLAMEDLGGKCVFASEWDKDAQDTYERNYGMRPCGDIKKIDEKLIPKHDVLCAGFPCQPFSKAGPQTGFEDETKGTLFFDIERILKYHKTKYIILENVRNLVSHDNGNTWKTIYSHLVKLGYRLTKTPLIVSPHNFGIPQLRERVVVLGVYDPDNTDKPLEVILPPFFDKADCSLDSILEPDNNDPDYKLTKDEEDVINIWDEFYKGIKEKVIGFPVWLEWFKNAPPESEEEMPEWKRSYVKKNNALYLNNKKFIDKWLERHDNLERFTPTMRKMEWQCGKAVSSAWDAFLQMRPSGLRIKRPDCAPALVAIVQVPIIGKYRRRMTVREAARLQSFDDRFIPNPNKHQAYKQFGNAVNVEVIKRCAQILFRDTKSIL